MNDGYLIGHGRLPWTAALDVVASGGAVQAAWFDNDGWHEGPLALDAPLTTHLWAWGRDRWIRMRVDQGSAIVGELRTKPPNPDTKTSATVEAVSFIRAPLLPWEDPHVGRPGIDRDGFESLEVFGLHSVIFVGRTSRPCDNT